MFVTPLQRLDHGARQLLPFATTFLFVLAGIVTWPIPYLGPLAPSLALVAVYYWALHRPDLFGPGSAFLIGLLHDALNFLPLGVTALIFVAIYQLIRVQRRFFSGHTFFMLWFGFALTMLIAMLTSWLILSLFQWHLIAPLPLLVQAMLTIVLFPLPAGLLIWVQRTLLSQS